MLLIYFKLAGLYKPDVVTLGVVGIRSPSVDPKLMQSLRRRNRSAVSGVPTT